MPISFDPSATNVLQLIYVFQIVRKGGSSSLSFLSVTPALLPSHIHSRLYVQQKALIKNAIGKQLTHEKHQRHFRSVYLRDGITCLGVRAGQSMVHGLREGGRDERIGGGSAPQVVAVEGWR